MKHSVKRDVGKVPESWLLESPTSTMRSVRKSLLAFWTQAPVKIENIRCIYSRTLLKIRNVEFNGVPWHFFPIRPCQIKNTFPLKIVYHCSDVKNMQFLFVCTFALQNFSVCLGFTMFLSEELKVEFFYCSSFYLLTGVWWFYSF